jgi:hypothetical protein
VAFAELLAETGVREQLTVQLADIDRVAAGPDAPLGRGGPDDYLQLDVPAPVPGWGQVVLDVGVDGEWRWQFAAPAAAAGAGRAAGTNRYVLPADSGVPQADETDGAPQSRGLVGLLGRRVLKVLLFKVLEVGGAIAAEKIVRSWEDDHRSHRLRHVAPGNQGDPMVNSPTLSPSDLRELLGGERALLLVHGTASRTDSCFRSMPDDVLGALAAKYGNRVFAFDHPTIAYDPLENVRWLSEQLPKDLAPKIDVMSHSRGGLVTRLLFERSDLGVDPTWFQNAVLVASPNQGTALASPDKLGRLLDALTNVVGAAPTNPVTDVLEVVLSVVKQLAVGALGGLDGLASMDPSMSWAHAQLPDPTDFVKRYRALGSNFEPEPGAAVFRIARDLATDAIFGGADNDLVVPTEGADLAGQITESLRLKSASAVDHSGYWRNSDATSQIRTWLGA